MMMMMMVMVMVMVMTMTMTTAIHNDDNVAYDVAYDYVEDDDIGDD